MTHTDAVSCSGCGTPTYRRYEGIPLCKSCDDDALMLAKRLLADRDAEIARLKAELAAEVENARLIAQNLADARRALKVVEAERDRRGRALVAHGVEIEKHDYTSYKAPVPVVTAAEIRTYMDKIADTPRTGGYTPVSPLVPPPAADPRVDAITKALCIVVTALVNQTWKRETDDGLSESVRKAIAEISWRE